MKEAKNIIAGFELPAVLLNPATSICLQKPICVTEKRWDSKVNLP